MTVYIAICDDNIADRKQFERLLEREKDKRLSSSGDVMYIDSFGSEEALMHTPIKYDIFFLDLTQGTTNGMTLAKNLRKKGISAPIVLCSSSINYSSFVNELDNIIFLDKPLNAGQISHLTEVGFEWSKSKTPLIELRGQKETVFVPYTELVRAVEKGKFVTEVTLSDGSYVTMADSLKSLRSMCRSYNCFTMCGKDIINVRHIQSYCKNKITLKNGDQLKFYFTQKEAILSTMTEVVSSLTSGK